MSSQSTTNNKKRQGVFDPNGRYIYGIKTSPYTKKNIDFQDQKVVSGQYFLDKECPDVETFLRKNPDKLDSERIYHFYQIMPDQSLEYVDQGNPYPVEGEEQTNHSLSDPVKDNNQAPVNQLPVTLSPVIYPNGQGNESLEKILYQKFEMERALQEQTIQSLKEQNAQSNAVHQNIINQLNARIRELEQGGNQEAQRVYGLLETKEDELSAMLDQINTMREEHSAKVREMEDKLKDWEMKFNGLKVEFDAYQKEQAIRDEYEEATEKEIQTLSDQFSSQKGSTLEGILSAVTQIGNIAALVPPEAKQMIGNKIREWLTGGKSQPQQYQQDSYQQPVNGFNNGYNAPANGNGYTNGYNQAPPANNLTPEQMAAINRARQQRQQQQTQNVNAQPIEAEDEESSF